MSLTSIVYLPYSVFQSHIGAIRIPVPLALTRNLATYFNPTLVQLELLPESTDTIWTILFQSHIGAIRIRPDKAEFDANLQLFAHFSKS